MTFGVDVSAAGQRKIDWTKVPANAIQYGGSNYPLSFVYTRSSKGTKDIDNTQFKDPYYDWNVAHAPATAHVGAYHVAAVYDVATGTKFDASDEARFFFAVAGGSIQAGGLRPALDVETAYRRDSTGHVTAVITDPSQIGWKNLADWIDEWMQTVYQLDKGVCWPVLYCSEPYKTNLGNQVLTSSGKTLAQTYDLWVAQYTDNPAQAPVITPWNNKILYQYTQSGPVLGFSRGIDVDVASTLQPLLINATKIAVVSKPSGVYLPNATVKLSGVTAGSTNAVGELTLPTVQCGSIGVEAIVGTLHYFGLLNIQCSSQAKSGVLTSESTGEANSLANGSYTVEMDANASCVSILPVNNFSVGDRVEVYGTGNGLRARYPDPCTDPPYRVLPDLSAGTIVGSWQCCGGYIRWKIRYDDVPGVDVWSAEGEPSTGQVFLRKKQNSTCSYSLAPGRLDLDTSGAAASGFNVNTGPSCFWTAVSNLDWISVTTNASGTGPAQVTFSVSANPNPYSRTGNVIVGDQTFIVTQPGTGSATSGWTLNVASSNPSSGVGVTVSPNDTNGLGNGTTTFTRNYNAYTQAYVTAPAGVGSTTFKKWQRDGVDWSTSTDTNLTMEGNHTMTALYIPVPDRYLAVFISPQQAVDAGAKWYLQGTGPYDSGQAIGPFNPGTTVQGGLTCKPLEGWIAPPQQDVVTANSGPTIVRVSYTVPPTLSLSANQISIGSRAGGANLLVTNPGGGSLNWSASTSDSWIKIETPAGSCSSGATASLAFSVQPNGGVGPRTGTVTVTANGATASPQSIIVTQRAQVAMPTISPNGGSFTGAVQVTLACATSGAVIYYTTDGSDPSLDSDIYSTPITLTSSTLVKAKAVKDGSDDSNIASASFSFPLSPTPTPVPTPAGTPTATATPTGTPAFPVQLGNIATRLKTGAGDNAMIGGFIIAGSQSKAVVVRGIGPSLGVFGVPGVLADPVIEVHGSAGELLATNDNWMDDEPDRVQHVIDSGLAPTNNLESAKWGILNPGNYTVVVRGKGNETGVGLFEVYDVDPTVDSKLANISTRGFVDAGDNAMIGGIIISGSSPAKVLFRAIGPSLTNVGVASALQDPTLELRDKQGSLMTSNDNWKETQEAAIIATTIPPMDDRESAILTTLQPGQYTAIVRGKEDSTGVAVVEAYQLP